MVKSYVEKHPGFKIFVTSSSHQLFITSSVTGEVPEIDAVTEKIYDRVADLLAGPSNKVVSERCFGSLGYRNRLIDIRNRVFGEYKIETGTPLTYIEGGSCFGNEFSGVQIRGIVQSAGTNVRTLMHNGSPVGRAWDLDGSSFLMLNNIGGSGPAGSEETIRKDRTESMFRLAEQILRSEGVQYKDVVRTWIYISDILKWYNDFNSVRNRCYSKFGLLSENDPGTEVERIFLPASTGIEGKNPDGMPAVMDLFAVRRSEGSSVGIRPIHSGRQLSPFRYGSAFSRAMVIEEAGVKQILISGTASIDEKGRSLFIGNPEAQIRNTLDIVTSLAAMEGAGLQNLCEATVFLKHAKAFPIFAKILEEREIPDIPSVNMIADVCRDELLFELDAVFITEKN